MSGRRARVAAAVALAVAATVHAAPRDEPIYLEADRVELDDVRGVSTYTGSVSVQQGNMALRGDKVVVHSKDRNPQRYVATGQPARFRQKPESDEPEVVATARELEYAVNDETLKLRGKAVIVQCGDRFEGEHLTYDAANSRVTAAGGESGRIRMVIQPQRNGERECAPAPASATP